MSWKALELVLDGGWLELALSAVIGLVLGWLAVKFVRLMALLAGFVAGAFFLPAAGRALGLNIGWFALALAGGTGGVILMALALGWGLVLATAFAGALILSEGLRTSLGLSDTVANIILLILLALGVAWQGSTMRRN